MDARTVLDDCVASIFDEICLCGPDDLELGLAIASDDMDPTFAVRGVGEDSSEMISALNLTLLGQKPEVKYKAEKFRFEYDSTAATIVLAYNQILKGQRISRIMVDVIIKNAFGKKGTFIKIVPIA